MRQTWGVEHRRFTGIGLNIFRQSAGKRAVMPGVETWIADHFCATEMRQCLLAVVAITQKCVGKNDSSRRGSTPLWLSRTWRGRSPLPGH